MIEDAAVIVVLDSALDTCGVAVTFVEKDQLLPLLPFAVLFK